MKNLILLIGLVVSSVCYEAFAYEGGKEWLSSPDSEILRIPPWLTDPTSEIPETDIYEVTASKEYFAVLRDLKEEKFIQIDEKLAMYFTGHYFKSSPEDKIYLVRAVNANGGTGGYSLYRKENSLIVYHNSLGAHAPNFQKSALIVRVSFNIDKLYNVAQVAE